MHLLRLQGPCTNHTALRPPTSLRPPDVLLIPPSPSITRLSSLPPSSLAPFLRAVQIVSSTLERLTGATSSNIAIQDGPQAGQSVPHLHVHILPRKVRDFEVSDEVSMCVRAHARCRQDGQLLNLNPNAAVRSHRTVPHRTAPHQIYAHLETFGFDLPTLQAKARARSNPLADAPPSTAAPAEAPARTPGQLAVDADAERVPRSREEMAAEAAWLRGVFEHMDFSA